jgi:hypothetical protein
VHGETVTRRGAETRLGQLRYLFGLNPKLFVKLKFYSNFINFLPLSLCTSMLESIKVCGYILANSFDGLGPRVIIYLIPKVKILLRVLELHIQWDNFDKLIVKSLISNS